MIEDGAFIIDNPRFVKRSSVSFNPWEFEADRFPPRRSFSNLKSTHVPVV
jgi:hypothetical protein